MRRFETLLITGVAGFVGSNLANDLLKRGYRVRGVDNFSFGTPENVDAGVDFRQCDIRAPELERHFQGVDAVFHLAAISSLPYCQEHPQEAVDVNISGTLNALECARKAGVKKVIYAGTSAAYEGCTEFPSREDMQPRPDSIYAVTKTSGELLTRSYGVVCGLDYAITRYFNVYGPAQDFRRVNAPVMSGFIKRMLVGEQPRINGDGSKERDFIYVDDVNELNARILESPRSRGEIINIGTGTSYRIDCIYGEIEKLMRTGLAPEFGPDLPGEAVKTLADISKARGLFRWEPRVTLQEGLRHSIAYLRGKLQAR